MKKFFAKQQDNKFIIDGEELLHLAVLRCKVGEKVICFLDNDKHEYLCEIEEILKKYATCKVISKQTCKGNPTKKLTVFQAMPKGDKLELIVQKLTELGAFKIIPFENNFSVAKSNLAKIDRLNKISKEACKQCGRSIPLVVSSPVMFKDMIMLLKDFDLVLLANEKEKINKEFLINKNNIAVIIGSEGGFSDKELEILISNNAKSISLGSRILRTETAAIAFCSVLNYLIEL